MQQPAKQAGVPPVFSSPAELRRAVGCGSFRGTTAGLCPGHTQTNLVILPAAHAFDFLLFCQRNPKPLPLLEAHAPGDPEPKHLAPGADIRTDCPRYIVVRGGRTEAVDDLKTIWRDDLVTFLLGCSFTFERALMAAGISIRHIDEGRNVPMFLTNRELVPAGPFRGRMVATMRPVPADLVPKAVLVTARYPGVHGAPIHVGCPETLGIESLDRPDYGDAVEVRPGEVPVFWACGVSGLSAVQTAGVEFAITHAPGHMFVTDRRDDEFSI